MNSLKLSTSQLSEIALVFRTRIKEGLATKNQQLKCLPTYIPLKKSKKNGKTYILDLGGSNLRAGIAAYKNGRIELISRSPKIEMPWQRNTPFDQRQYLDIQATVLADLNCRENLPLGYCFSYPAEPTLDRDAILLKWAKGIDIPGTLGKKMGRLLTDHIAKHFPEINCSGVTVINDTVAALIGGMNGWDNTSTIGLIAGTGTNMATVIDPADIPKLTAADLKTGPLPINLESGNFTPPHLTKWDEIVDQNSNNPGEQRLEKAVSGAYLGNIFNAIFPDSSFDVKAGGAELVKILHDPDRYPDNWVAAANLIYNRSADLTAGALAGLISLLFQIQGHTNIRIIAEGALFWGEVNGTHRYCDRAESTLKSLLSKFKLDHLTLDFIKKDHANLIGSAMAALTF